MTIISDSMYPQLQYLVADNIHSDGVAAVFTSRNGGVSGLTADSDAYRSLNLQYHTEGDSDENVAENYRIIASALGFQRENVVSAHQKHTDRIVTVGSLASKSRRSATISEGADALVTNVRGMLLSVRTADCVPILLYDPMNGAVAAVHSGWRGTFLGISAKAVRHMAEQYTTDPSHIKAAIGPAIGPCCYEVGLDVYGRFRSEYGETIEQFFCFGANQRPLCDLSAMNRAFLTDAGVPVENIEVSPLCTQCNPGLFFSHRRSGFKRGAMAAFIGMHTAQ